MKKKISFFIVSLLIAVVIILSSGCATLILGSAGAASYIGDPYTVKDSIPGWKFRMIRPGTQVNFIMKDSSRVSGEYRGLIGVPENVYNEKYYKSQLEMPDGIILPLPGDIITYTLLTSEEKHDVIFAGFDYGYLTTKQTEKNETENLSLENIKNITDAYGNKIGGEILKNLILEGELPLLSKISIKEGQTEKLLDINDISQIQIKTKKNDPLKGFLIGGIIDATIAAAFLIYLTQADIDWY
jgi:hypothetical protein